MDLRCIGTCVAGMILLIAPTYNHAQVKGKTRSSSASHVAAEMTKGKLNSAESKQGDIVVLKLKEDVKSNGRVVLKKGTPIIGVVRNVKRTDATGHARSMMAIEWFAPEVQGKAAQNLSIALRSVTQVNPTRKNERESKDDFARSARTTLVSGSATRVSGLSNPALLSMPSVVALDDQTSSNIENNLGVSSSGQLFKIGSGQLVTASGAQQSVDIFSHLNNDTVMTSASKDFEISPGAQMQLLVGVNRK